MFIGWIRSRLTRDHLLLIVGWIAALLAAVAAWTSHSQTIGISGRVLGGTWWAWALLSLQAAAVIILLAAPLLGAIALLMPRVRSAIRRWLTSFPRRPLLLAMLTGIGLAQPLAFVDIGRVAFTLGFLTIVAIVLLILILYLGPQPMPASISMPAILWLALVVTTRVTLQTLVSLLRGHPGLDWAEGWTMAFTIVMALLIVAPPLAAWPGTRAIPASILRIAMQLPLLAGVALLLVGAATGLAVRAADAAPTGLWALQRFMGLLAVIVGGLALTRSQIPVEADHTIGPRDLRPWLFWAGLAILILAYAVQAVRLGFNQLYFLNPDGVAYAIITRYFAHGVAAIRGYWSPLMPAVLAPFVRLGADPQVAQRFLSGILGLAWTALVLLLGKRVGLRRTWLLVLAGVMGILSLEVVFVPVTPDVLGAVILTAYFLLVTGDRFLERPWLSGIAAGALGALAFYAKFYSLPFFLVHLFLTCLLLIGVGQSIHKAALAVIVAFCTAALLVSPWVLALRSRYGMVTLTTSAAINHAIFGPSMTWHPCWDQRLCDMPKDTLIPWEDPQLADYADVGWSPMASWDNLRHQILLVQTNLQDFSSDVAFELGPFPPAAVLLSLIAVIALPLDRRTRFSVLWAMMSVLVYMSGYMTFLTSVRYMAPILPIAFLGGFQAIQWLFDHLSVGLRLGVTGWSQLIFGVAVCLSILDPQTAGLRPLPPDHGCVAQATAAIADRLVPPLAGSDRWVNIIAYYSEKRTIGVLPPSTAPGDADNELRRHGVRTYLVGSRLPLGAELLSREGYSLIAETNICGERFHVLRTPVP